MITKFVRNQLIAFSILSIVGIVVILGVYAQVPALLGVGQRAVSAHFTDAAGLYQNARVTFRGAEVGRVTSVAADARGAVAHMSLSDRYEIPVSSRAEIHSVSVIGEQYIDLVPGKDQAPYLADGADIPVERTQTPHSIASVLETANRLVSTLPTESLDVSLDELAKAFDGTGPKMQRVLDQSTELLEEADTNFEATSKLLQDAGPALETQQVTSPQIRSLVGSLASFTETVREKDPELRAVLDHGGPAAAQVRGTMEDLQPNLPILLPSVANVAESLANYNPALEQLLVTYPRLTTAMITTNLPQHDGSIGLDLRLVVQDPQPCTTGFLPPSQQHGPSYLSTEETRPGVYCKLPHDNPSVVRGVRNLPCMEVPGKRAATPAECRGEGYRPERATDRMFPEGSPLEPLNPAGPVVWPGTSSMADEPLAGIGAIGQRSSREEDLKWVNMLLDPSGQ